MAFESLLQLANDLEWLGCELEQVGHRHALEGYPHTGSTWQEFAEKQKGVLATCDKVERELKSAVRFDPQALVGVEFQLEDAIEAIARLLENVEGIKYAAVYEVHRLPEAVRSFNSMVHEGFGPTIMPTLAAG